MRYDGSQTLTSLHPTLRHLPVMAWPMVQTFRKKAPSGGPVAFLGEQFPHRPYVIGNSGFHRTAEKRLQPLAVFLQRNFRTLPELPLETLVTVTRHGYSACPPLS